MKKPIETVGLGPTRIHKKNQDGTWTLTVTPASWSGFKEPSVLIFNEDEYQRYLEYLNEGMMIQEAFPFMSPEMREQIVSGITPREWNRVFKDK